MYSRKKGKSGSKKPLVSTPKPWITYTPQEVEQLIVKLSKLGKSSAVIGIVLRDSYGIPDVPKLINKKIYQVIKEHKLAGQLPEDISSLIRRQMILTKHLQKNKQDGPARRGLLITESKINKLAKYYKRNKVLPKNWNFSREQQAKLFA